MPVPFPAGTGGGADQMARLIQGIVVKHNLMKEPLVVAGLLLVAVAIISVLAGMVFPVFARARESARKAQAANADELVALLGSIARVVAADCAIGQSKK